MTTVLVFVLWIAGPHEGRAATSFSQEFETHAACADAWPSAFCYAMACFV